MLKPGINFLEAYNASQKVEQNNKNTLLKGFVFAFVFFAVGLIAFFALSDASVIAAPAPPSAPTVLSVAQGSKYTLLKPLITGVTINETSVDVYIDGVFNGRARVADHESGTASFAYYPFLNLKPGKHTLYSVARTKIEPIQRSRQSETVDFEIVGFVPPTLFAPIFNLETTESRPFIVGLARNDSSILVYVDGELDGGFDVKNHPSGTANFAYKPGKDLTIGEHSVSVVAFNKTTGQKSKSSEISFVVEAPYPAPVLLKPVTAGTTATRPYITGVAKSGSTVEVYINEVKKVTMISLEHPSGTASFACRPDVDLAAGTNVITAVAISASTGKMSRLSQPVYYQVGEVAQKVTEPEEEVAKEPEVVAKEEPAGEKKEEPEVVLFPQTGEKEQPELKVEEEEKKEGELEVKEKEEEKITGEEEAPVAVSGEREPEEGEEPGDEEGRNWSKIIGLVILAILIIILIIQLLRKEEGEGTKKGETLRLFEEGEKEGKEDSAKGEKDSKDKDKGEDTTQGQDVPPPPPSSNLPF